MRFEHFALNVADARVMADWYVEHCGLRRVRAGRQSPYVHFLADPTGRVMMELYSNPVDPVPDYEAQHPLRFHFAFAVQDPTAVKKQLLSGGASLVNEKTLDDGSEVIMLRDPWGVPVQLCKRMDPLV